jgi:hypothetical protein
MQHCIQSFISTENTGRATTPTLAFPAFSLNNQKAVLHLSDLPDLTSTFKNSQTGPHLDRDDPERCNQLKIMPFIRTSLDQSESASLKACMYTICRLPIGLWLRSS